MQTLFDCFVEAPSFSENVVLAGFLAFRFPHTCLFSSLPLFLIRFSTPPFSEGLHSISLVLLLGFFPVFFTVDILLTLLAYFTQRLV
jgi:hypothetical protein